MTKPIKIVRIIARLNIGGPAVNVSILSSSLNRDIFQTTVIYGSLAEGEAGLEHILRSEGVRMELVPELGREINPIDDLKALWKIYNILRKEKPDIVHTHTAKAGTLGRIAAILAGTKVKVHTFHGNVFRHYFGRLRTKAFVLIERFLGLFTTKVITVSARQKSELTKEFRIIPDDKCYVVPLGVDIFRLTKDVTDVGMLRRQIGAGEDAFLVGMLGRIVPVKNHRMLLEAALRVKNKRSDINVRYVIVGRGELERELKNMVVSMGLDKVFNFLGWREDLGNIYAGLDVVALTSMNEGTPLALIEAMAMGKAIIATDVGGVPDIIDDGNSGILVRRDDAEDFAGKLIGLLDDKVLRDKLGRVALSQSKRFEKQNLVNIMTEFYKECVESHASGRENR